MPAVHEMVGCGQRINESAAYRLYIERRAVFRAQLGLQNTGCTGKHHIRRGGGDNDQAEFFRADSSGLHRALTGDQGEVAGKFAIRRNVALSYARATENPFVGRFNTALKILVGQHFGRQVTPCSDDSCVACVGGHWVDP